MDRRSITIVIVVVLCAVGFAYGQGWLDWSRTGTEMESNKVSVNQALDQEKMKEDAVLVTQTTVERADTATE